MKKVAVIGHFGFGGTYLDGQTVKTKNLTAELERVFGVEQVLKVDTHGGAKKTPSLLIRILGALKSCENLIILPASNGLRIIAPYLAFLNKFYRRKLFYVVIGGWLPEFLEKKKGLTSALKKFDGIFVEAESMELSLEKRDFKNVFVMPNFKRLSALSESELVYSEQEPLKICTFSRVSKEKGIADAVSAVICTNEKLNRTAYTLDVYGQIDKDQVEWFDELSRSFPEYIRYGGCIPFDESTETLKEYFALLFPTYYKGEGFAGTVIDAFSAGVPVIASNWKYNGEIIRENYTGRIFEPHDVSELVRILVECVENPTLICNMKTNCLQEAIKYSPEAAIKILVNEFS